jgi:uncharacterized protein YqhQ
MSATSIGGQAVPEGVMLRGAAGWALAVRRTDGTIAVSTERTRRSRTGLAKRPFLRGLAAVGDAFVLGLRTLSLATVLRHPVLPPPPTARQRLWGTVSLIGAALFAAALFGLLPVVVASHIHTWPDHVVEPLARTAAIVLYIAAVGVLPEIRRVFGYHGAEHQVVAAYEAGSPDASVTAPRASGYSRFHPRCGTTFIVLVALIEGLVHGLPMLPASPMARAVEVPLAIMIAYEAVYLATNHRRRWWARAILAPGRALQRLTTRPPDHGQLEVGCAALDALLLLERRSRSEDQDEQQDDQQKYDNSTTDVHGSSFAEAPCSIPGEVLAETRR